MIADLGTKRGAQLEDVDRNCYQINGIPWMRMKTEDFPTKGVMEISLNSEELDQMKVLSNKEF